MKKRSLFLVLFFLSLLHTAPQLFGGIAISVPSENVRSINEGILLAKEGDTVWVAPGSYKEAVVLKPGITLASRQLFKAEITGNGRDDLVTLAYQSTILGFSIQKGNTGIISRSPGNTILKCRIYRNRRSGIICIGTIPRIEHSIIVFNEGSGIQAVEITGGHPAINHNTISYNGNNGIAFDGAFQIVIKNNIITSNGGHAIKVDHGEITPRITNNLFFNNYHNPYLIPEGNFSFDPLFISARRRNPDFNLCPDSPALKRADDNTNLGAVLSE